MSKKVKLGEKYRDTVTGFTGVATARYEFLNGCVRYCLEAGGKESHDQPQELTFDEQRLVEAETDKAPEPTARRGGSRSAAPRTGMRA